MTSLGTFKSIFSLDCAWGMVSISNGGMEYDIYAGQLTIQNIPLPKNMPKTECNYRRGRNKKLLSRYQ